MSKNKTQVCDICGTEKLKNMSLKLTYYDDTDEEKDYKIIDYVCSDKCLHKRIN